VQAPDFPSIFFYILFYGAPATLQLTAHGRVWGFILGLALAFTRVYGGRELGWIAIGYENVLRGIPLLVLIMIFGFGVPGLFSFIDPTRRLLAAVILSLALRSAAFQSQLLRGAILSVDPGQLLAARALGMNQLQAFRHVILPQALRIAIPSWSNEFAVVIKDTSYAYSVGVIEMTREAMYLGVSNPALMFPIMVALALVYFIFTYPVTKVLGERQAKKLKALGLGGGQT
jgi:polar amino acid transport system permease protein